MKKYVVDLNEDAQEQLQELTTKGTSGARKIRRAHILLLADKGLIDKEIARAMNASRPDSTCSACATSIAIASLLSYPVPS